MNAFLGSLLLLRTLVSTFLILVHIRLFKCTYVHIGLNEDLLPQTDRRRSRNESGGTKTGKRSEAFKAAPEHMEGSNGQWQSIRVGAGA